VAPELPAPPQAWVEQKNGAVVRCAVGYRRYEGLEAAAALGRLYTPLRLFVTSSSRRSSWPERFAMARRSARMPSPCHALSAVAGRCVRRRATATYTTLESVRLLKTIREIHQELVGLADHPALGLAAAPTASTLEQFLSGLRTA
jgi:hypothetical protein